MKRKKCKALLLSVGVIVAFGILVLMFGVHCFNWFKPMSWENVWLSKRIEEANSDIIIFGNIDSSDDTTVKHRKIDKINKESFEICGKNGYHIIVLSDLDGQLQITDEELALIYLYCTEEHFDVLYCGTEHREQIKDIFLNNFDNLPEGFLWFTGYEYKYDFPFEKQEIRWKRTDRLNSFALDPYLVSIGSDEDIQEAQKKPNQIWWYISACVFLSVEKEDDNLHVVDTDDNEDLLVENNHLHQMEYPAEYNYNVYRSYEAVPVVNLLCADNSVPSKGVPKGVDLGLFVIRTRLLESIERTDDEYAGNVIEFELDVNPFETDEMGISLYPVRVSIDFVTPQTGSELKPDWFTTAKDENILEDYSLRQVTMQVGSMFSEDEESYLVKKKMWFQQNSFNACCADNFLSHMPCVEYSYYKLGDVVVDKWIHNNTCPSGLLAFYSRKKMDTIRNIICNLTIQCNADDASGEDVFSGVFEKKYCISSFERSFFLFY